MSSLDPNPRSHRGTSPRVLLVGRDRRYLTEAALHLRARGFDVSSTCRPSEIVGLVRRLDLDVAVVDGSHYVAAIVRTMAAVEAVARPLTILTVVDDSLISPLSRPEVLPKWASLPRLEEHIEVACERRSTAHEARVEPGVAVA
jgi:hypothetical protein